MSAFSGDQVYADIGGFLGIGATTVHLSGDQIANVKDDRIDLKITEDEAKRLPSAGENSAPAK